MQKKILFKTNKKAFTLVELLAVIVILAAIMLIATPIVIGVVGDARKNAFEVTATSIMKAVENDYMAFAIDGNTDGREILFGEDYNGELSIRGKLPETGRVVVDEEGNVAFGFTDGDFCAQKTVSSNRIILTKLDELEGICEIPYFSGNVEFYVNPDTGTITAVLPEVNGPNVEYSLDGENWRSSNIFHGLGSEHEYTFNVKIDGELQADSITVTTPAVYMLTTQVSDVSGGTIDPQVTYVLNEDIVMPVITTNEGYTFAGLSVISGSADIDAENRISNIVGDTVIEAQYMIIFYTVHYEVDEGASINPLFRTVAHNGSVTAPTITITSGYEFNNFYTKSGEGSGTLNTVTGAVSNIVGNMTIGINFILNEYTVTYSSTTGGSVSPGSRIVSHGSNLSSVTATPNTGYSFTNFSIVSGAANVGGLNTSTGALTNVTGPVGVRANFTLNTYTVSYNSNGGTCTPTSRSINHGNSAAAPSCNRSGFTLTSYTITSGSCAGTFSSATGSCSSVTQNITIRANWTEVPWTLIRNNISIYRTGPNTLGLLSPWGMFHQAGDLPLLYEVGAGSGTVNEVWRITLTGHLQTYEYRVRHLSGDVGPFPASIQNDMIAKGYHVFTPSSPTLIMVPYDLRGSGMYAVDRRPL